MGNFRSQWRMPSQWEHFPRRRLQTERCGRRRCVPIMVKGGSVIALLQSSTLNCPTVETSTGIDIEVPQSSLRAIAGEPEVWMLDIELRRHSYFLAA